MAVAADGQSGEPRKQHTCFLSSAPSPPPLSNLSPLGICFMSKEFTEQGGRGELRELEGWSLLLHWDSWKMKTISPGR